MWLMMKSTVLAPQNWTCNGLLMCFSCYDMTKYSPWRGLETHVKTRALKGPVNSNLFNRSLFMFQISLCYLLSLKLFLPLSHHPGHCVCTVNQVCRTLSVGPTVWPECVMAVTLCQPHTHTDRKRERTGDAGREKKAWKRERAICQQFSCSSNRLSRCWVAAATRLRLLPG